MGKKPPKNHFFAYKKGQKSGRLPKRATEFRLYYVLPYLHACINDSVRTLGHWGVGVEGDAGGSGGLPENRHPTRISAEVGDLSLDPFHGLHLVQHPEVRGGLRRHRREESEDVEAVVRGDDDDVAGGEVPGRPDHRIVRGGPDFVAPSVDEKHDGELRTPAHLLTDARTEVEEGYTHSFSSLVFYLRSERRR